MLSRDRIATLIVWSATAAVTLLFFWIVGDILAAGWSSLSWEFLTTAPRDAGRQGGIAPILVSTGLILAVCLAASLPVGIATAVLLSEFTRKRGIFGRLLRRSLDVLAGVPSIVFGLFGNAFFSQFLGLGFSILSGGLTLAFMVLPILIRLTEEGLRSVPDAYRQGAAALGLTERAALFHLLLPAAMPAILTGLILGVGRALAETAALLFTSGYVDRMPQSLFDSGRALSVHIFDLAMNVPGATGRAYGAAFLLVMILLAINLATAFSARYWHRTLLSQ